MTKQLQNLLDGNLDEYKSIPFWSWNNALDENELVKQIEQMKREGIGGFIMHARLGLLDEYLGEKWFSCIDACLKKAKELNMQAWIYDENGWPSGFVGGKLLEVESFRARFLAYSIGEWDKTAFASFVVDQQLGFKRVTAPQAGVQEYHNIYLRVSPANTDILNPDVVDAFIQATHEEYYRRFPESFGRELAGFFTDEPQYYRWATPYTPCAEQVFEKDGEDIRDGLIWLFVHDERGYAYRAKYFHTLNELYTDNFYKKLYDWCSAHNCKLTGHSIEESILFAQMWGGGAVSPSYEFEHIPAIDALGRSNVGELGPKQAASVAAQLGKRQILTETFACSGNDVTPIELKNIGESQYFHGVNLMCQHLYPYSMAGQGKFDHPPVFGRHGNWGDGFKIFNDYFTRLGAIVANTKDCVDVAILHPQRNVWLEYVHKEDQKSVEDLQAAYDELITELRKNGVTYQWIDERILARHGSVEEGLLRVGECAYSTVIIPKMYSIAESSYALLQKFNGKLCVLQAPTHIDGKKAEVHLSGNCSSAEIKSSAEISYTCADGNACMTHRKGEIGEFIFVKNLSMTEESKISFQGVAEGYMRLDLETLQETPIQNDITLAPADGIILIRDEKAERKSYVANTIDITKNFQVTGMTENFLVLDYAQIAKNGGAFGKRYPITGLFDELLYEDYKGEIIVRQTFTLQEKMPLTLIMEKAKLKWAKVNGQEISFTANDFDIKFVEANIDDLVKTGENEFTYAIDFWQHDGVHFALFDPLATESVKNCLYYDTSIETIYLKGDFVVDKDMSLARRKALPKVSSNLYKEGYPFFKGTLTLQGKFDYNGEEKVALGLMGRYMVAEVKINGKEQLFTLSNEYDITSLLSKGQNEVKITLCSSLRNLFGPHHWALDAEPKWVNPLMFTLRAHWKNGRPSQYTDTYHSVPFGIDSVYCVIKRACE